MLESGDRLLIGSEAPKDETPMNIREVIVDRNHSWNGVALRDLDISRQTFVIMVHRSGRNIIPKGDFVFRIGDEVVLYSKTGVPDAGAEDE